MNHRGLGFVALILCAWLGVARASDRDVGRVKYKPGRWVSVRIGHGSKLRFRMMLEPLLRYSHVVPPEGAPGADDTTDLIIRRGRLGLDLDGDHGLGLRFEMSVKNMHSEIHNMFGYWRPTPLLELQVGFIKAPGGLERDTFSFDQPFIERSVITFFNRDHEVGAQ